MEKGSRKDPRVLPSLRRRKTALLGVFIAGLVFLLQDAAVFEQWLEEASVGDDADYCRGRGHDSAPDTNHGLACAQHCLRYGAQRQVGLNPPRPEATLLRWVALGWASAVPPAQAAATPGTRGATLPRGPPETIA